MSHARSWWSPVPSGKAAMQLLGGGPKVIAGAGQCSAASSPPQRERNRLSGV